MENRRMEKKNKIDYYYMSFIHKNPKYKKQILFIFVFVYIIHISVQEFYFKIKIF